MTLGYPTNDMVLSWRVRVNSNTAWVRTLWVPCSYIFVILHYSVWPNILWHWRMLCCGCSSRPATTPHTSTGSTTSAGKKKSQTGSNNELLIVNSGDDEVDVDVLDVTSNKDKRTSTTTTLLPEVVELASVDSELNLDTDGDDWLSSLLRYDDETMNGADRNSWCFRCRRELTRFNAEHSHRCRGATFSGSERFSKRQTSKSLVTFVCHQLFEFYEWLQIFSSYYKTKKN